MYARSTARIAERQLGQPVVVENRPGALGLIGPASVARAKPDGYTIGQVTITQFRGPYVTKVTFDPVNDFSFIIGMVDYNHILYAPASSRFKTLQDVVKAARAAPDTITLGTTGNGGTGHLVLADLAVKASAKLVHVPYKGAPEAATNLAGGFVDLAVLPYAVGQQTGDRIRPVAVFASTRDPYLPSVPTSAEQGWDVGLRSPLGIAGPKGMPAKIVQRLHDAFLSAMKDPSHETLMRANGLTAWHKDSAEYQQWGTQQYRDEAILVKQAGLMPSN